MIPLTIADLERLELGALRVRDGATEISGVEIDSRRVRGGDLFVAAGVGGASYVDDALKRGAAAALTPDHEHAALAALGTYVRDRLNARVVAITGSVGKTTTKDILAALCAPHLRTVAAEASYNNELGVPLTLCRADESTELVILELGMRGLGQVAELCEIARPHIGVITSIGPAHLELVGTVDDVAVGKGELLRYLPADGTAVVPAHEQRLDPFLGSCRARIVRVGPEGEVALVSHRADGRETEVKVQVEGSTLDLRFNVIGRHNIENAVTAVAVCAALGVPLERLQAGAGAVSLSPLRGEEVELDGGGLLLNDSYNANPMSMAAALVYLDERAGERRRVAVLGAMAELGPDEASYHRDVGALLAKHHVDVLIGIGGLASHYAEGLAQAGSTAAIEVVDSTAQAIDALRAELRPGDCVLVKASRASGLEVVAEAIESIVA